jgi:hypothetical protein
MVEAGSIALTGAAFLWEKSASTISNQASIWRSHNICEMSLDREIEGKHEKKKNTV